MITLPLAGENAVTKRWIGDPAAATTAIGEGLRALHNTLPVARCPFSWSAAGRVADAHQWAEAGEIDPVEWDEAHRPLGLRAALPSSGTSPRSTSSSSGTGDTCAPNTLVDDSGNWS